MSAILFTAFFLVRPVKSPRALVPILGKNIPTRCWYSAYSGYFSEEINSVNHVEAWKRMIRMKGPTIVQLYNVPVTVHDHWYKVTQIAESS